MSKLLEFVNNNINEPLGTLLVQELDKDKQQELVDILLNEPFFENVKSIKIIDYPVVTDNDTTKLCLSYKYGDKKCETLTDVFNLYTINLTPEMYDIEDCNGLDYHISPLLFNPNDFSPYKFIKLVFSPKNSVEETLEELDKLHEDAKQFIKTHGINSTTFTPIRNLIIRGY